MRFKISFFIFVALALILLIVFMIDGSEHYRRTRVDYQIPEVTLINQSGQPVALKDYLECELPLMLEFAYTSCTTLCADQSVKFSNLQHRLGSKADTVRLVSISIDPETDRPDVLQAFLVNYQALPGWDFLTGTVEDIQQVMQAFDISPTNMISYDSALLMRQPRTGEWSRIDGRLNNQDFWQEYKMLID